MDLLHIPILSILTFLPFTGALFVMLIDQSVSRANARQVGLWVSGFTFFLALCLSGLYGTTETKFLFEERYLLTADLGLEYHVALDALSLLFVLISTSFFFLVMFASWNEDAKDPKFFVFLLLTLETLVLGSLLSLNLLVFYIFFESVMVPVYFLSNIQKITDKSSSSESPIGIRNVLYTLIGSIFLLISILKIFDTASTFAFTDIIKLVFTERVQLFLCLGFIISFLIKMPVFPFHTWLPYTYRTSHQSLALLLSGVVTKLSFYALLRFPVSLFSESMGLLSPYLKWFFLVGLSYSLLSMYGEKHMNRLFAHLDLSHTALSLFFVVSLLPYGLFVGLFHAAVTAIAIPIVYYIAGMLTQRLQTDRIKFFGGVLSVMPHFSILFFLGCYMLMPLPGSPFYLSILYIAHAIMGKGVFALVFLTLSAFIISLVLIWLYRRTVFGLITEAMVRGLQDLSVKEVSISVIMLCILLTVGIFPGPLTDLVHRGEYAIKSKMKYQVQR